MVFLLKELHLEGQNREELVNIALNSLDAVLFPCPYLGGDIIIDGTHPIGFQKLSNTKIKTWIVDKDDNVRMPLHNVLLTHLHIFKNGAQME